MSMRNRRVFMVSDHFSELSEEEMIIVDGGSSSEVQGVLKIMHIVATGMLENAVYQVVEFAVTKAFEMKDALSTVWPFNQKN